MNELQLEELLLVICRLAKSPMYAFDKQLWSERAGWMIYALGSIVGLCSNAIEGEPAPPHRVEVEDHWNPHSTAPMPDTDHLGRVVEDVGWRGIRIYAGPETTKRSSGGFSVKSGTFIALSRRVVLRLEARESRGH
jgi:hypothetical protein